MSKTIIIVFILGIFLTTAYAKEPFAIITACKYSTVCSEVPLGQIRIHSGSDINKTTPTCCCGNQKCKCRKALKKILNGFADKSRQKMFLTSCPK